VPSIATEPVNIARRIETLANDTINQGERFVNGSSDADIPRPFTILILALATRLQDSGTPAGYAYTLGASISRISVLAQ
jgi:hypothetical protein